MKWKCKEECPYTRYPKIPPTKTFDADLAVVGEGPGITELSRKKPFVGDSGDVLNKSLKAADLPPREEVFITNAMLCRAAKKPIKNKALWCCRPRVIQELKEVDPEVVLVLGSSALRTITNDPRSSITRQHSKAFRIKELPNTVMVPAYHPAALFRSPGDYRTYKQALIYASIILHHGERAIKKPGETNYTTLETVEEAVEKLKEWSELDKEIVLGADIETGGFDPLEDEVLCLGICIDEGFTYIIPDSIIHDIPKQYFQSDNFKWCFHDGSFDTAFLQRENLPVGIDHDTILLHYCLDEHAGGHGLETLSMRFLGADAYDSEVKKHAKKGRGYKDVPRDILYPYLAKDCDYTKRLFNMFEPKVESDSDLRKLYNTILIPASAFLRQVFDNGIFVNRPYTEKLDKQLEKEENQAVDTIREHFEGVWDPDKYMKETGKKSAGTDGDPDLINPNSTYQLAWVLFDQLGLPAMRGKGRSTDADVLDHLEGKHPVIPHIKEFRKIKKKRSTYVQGILKRISADGRIHSRYSLYRSVTGRLSSRNPNMQNIQRDPQIKNIFAAPEGKKLVELDYSSAELRTLQYLSGDKELKRIFDEGGDLHDEVAEDMFGPDFTKEQRVGAKTINFGIAYGRTPYSIARDFEIPLEEATRRVSAWLEKFPGAAEYLFECDKQAERGEVLVTPFGRKRRFGLVAPMNVDDLKKEARNFRIQSVASDLTLLSAMEMEEKLREEWNVKIVNLVHDSVLLEIDDDMDTILAASRYADKVMREVPDKYLNPDIVFATEAEIGQVWGDLEVLDLQK